MNSQLIVVAPDEVVKAAEEAEVAARQPKKGVDFTKIGENALGMLYGASFANVFAAGAEALIAWSKARQSGLNVTQISQTHANSLTFPPGHPREGVLYVAHPAAKGVYFTVASFHRLAFEHKFSEAIDLLMSLGATEIKVEHVRGWSRDFAGNLSVPVQQTTAGVELSGKQSNASELLYEAHLPGNTEPKLPESLVWYPHEPTWQSMARGRIKFGLAEFSLTVNYEDDFGINAGFKINAGESGLDLGGSFEDHRTTTWKIHGKFLGK
ncbi:hypothetical protein LIG30_4911 [Burkholderia sp. lig30]|jgi:hypothetical protein|uniref:hypothetical protein n=1 Tax=Burkholderia sp. lig30 TaxID=1192124 RepID=UPI0004618C65|nr:hypothetical protein [Burkholderia sp. lig30]KDB10487.1 hypothetical protein LIG30_4911 [Burkholderia sp. lig30]